MEMNQPASALARKLNVTVFPDLSGATKHEVEISLIELARHIEETVADAKDQLPLIKLAVFGDLRSPKQSFRFDANLREVHGLEVDYDGGAMQPEAMAEAMRQAGVPGVVYTSPSCTPDKPRWRCIAPFSKPMPTEFRARAVSRLQGLTNASFAGESWTASQAYFIGHVAGTPPPRVWLVDEGEPIDLRDDLDRTARGKAAGAKPSAKPNGAAGPDPGFAFDAGGSESDAESDLEAIRLGRESHAAMVRLAGRWARGGMAAADITAALKAALLARPEAERDQGWRDAAADLPRLGEWAAAKEEAKAPCPSPAPSPGESWPEPMNAAAFYGLAGDVVRALEPHTESDPVAILLQTLVYFGNAVGRGPYYLVESDRHHANLFVVIAGRTAKARKGTSEGRVRRLFTYADETWERERVLSGLSSGEGLIWAVRNPITTMKEGVAVVTDDGVADKRMLVAEREFAGALAVMKREGSILSRVVRDAWDRGDLATLTKNNPSVATNAHISCTGHISLEELRSALDQTSMLNGYANRFLFACVRRSRLLPHGGDLAEAEIAKLGHRLQNALELARKVQRVRMTQPARAQWEVIYTALSEDLPGLLGAVTARGEAQVIRVSLLFALLDGKAEIDVEHLRAAVAVWEFCEASARTIFGGMTGEPVADGIMQAVRNAGAAGLSRLDITTLFQRNVNAARIERALGHLARIGKVRRTVPPPGKGRPPEIWVAV